MVGLFTIEVFEKYIIREKGKGFFSPLLSASLRFSPLLSASLINIGF